MKALLSAVHEFFRKGDLLLLALCLTASGYGILLIYSATRYMDNNRSLIVQTVAVIIGVVLFGITTFVDLHTLLEKAWKFILFFNFAFVFLVLTPLGEERYGNLNWIRIPGIPINIQPDEIVKLTFILLLAYQISYIQDQDQNISSVRSVAKLTLHLMFMVGTVAVICGDMGMCVIYICIFAAMTWAAGVKLRWFAGVGSCGMAAVLVLWNFVLPKTKYWNDYRIMRFRVVLDHDLDPLDKGFQQTRSLLAIGSGQLTGQGYLNGTQTQAPFSDALPVRESDFIFSVCGEEFGMIGCLLLLGILSLIVLRCIWVARHSDSRFSAYVAIGAAGMLIAQITFNVGMCLFVAPVMGLTLPFFSYGGSSVVTMYAAMGLVSSIKAQSSPSWLKDRSST